MTCGAVHPDRPDIICRVTQDRHPVHVHGYGTNRVTWANDAVTPRLLDLAAVAEDIASNVEPERHAAQMDLNRRRAFLASQEAQDRVYEAADEDWKQMARMAVRQVIDTHVEFMPDDVWATGLPKPKEARALGPIMMEFVKRGEIIKTGRSEHTAQVRSHARDVTIWRVVNIPPDAPGPLRNFD